MTRILMVLLLAAPLGAAAEMYKWVDEKGRTVYSEQPPPDGKASTKLDIRNSPSSNATADWKQKENDARQQKIVKEQQEQGQKAQEQNVMSAKKQNCAESQRQLAIVQAQRPVFQVNEKGEKVYLEDKDRQREIDGWEANVKKYCE